MSAAVVVEVGAVGGLGATARFALDGVVAARVGREFPYGTMLVNVLGSFMIGVLVGAALSQNAHRLAGTGLLGAFTTFSTWVFESHRLGEDGELHLAAVNFAISLILGIAAAWAGRHVGAWL